ncbi:MAG: polyribonucleotide nucleotidyltransferase [Dehalococcoidia bacterium]|nr:polyribonucleotide nucleotidyltransferase [Dehalococcoidia bacterium]MBF8303790.1 polyribonucleotide nucleotidyltransferase [Dehalococcoidia bacterium]
MKTFQIEVGGKPLTIEVGRLALQANGAVVVSYGDTIVLVTACVGGAREGVDFLPLTVDYEERLYAAGKIPGSFIRREGRPGQEATLASRLVDRPLRPLFPKGFHNEVQIVITTLSSDQENEPDILAIIGASAALTISEIPFFGPISATRVGYKDGKFIVNPTYTQLNDSLIELTVAGSSEAVAMLEAGAKEAPESLILDAIKFAQEINSRVIKLQDEIRAACGKPKMEFTPTPVNPELVKAAESLLGVRMADAVKISDRQEREQTVEKIKKEVSEALGDKYPTLEKQAILESKLKTEIRNRVLKDGVRFGGRGFNEIRPITMEVGILPRTHGSGLFTRGQTQVLTIATLGSRREEQLLDGLSQDETKRFMHHYNFPSFSTGEVKRMIGPGRREIGHGALVERALLPIIPDEQSFPYTIRLVSEVLSSSGSTSQASVCASSLSLMDAGVPIKTPVAGVAIGLITDDTGRHEILTDIEGWEDAYGDMDFKAAGTMEGLTALQMDIKLRGVSFEIIEKAFSRARDARLQILDKMKATIATSRDELSKYAPRMYKITIPVDKIGAIIGPGGKTIRSITEETKTTIDVQNDGTVIVGSPNEESAQKAIHQIEGLTRDVELGTIYTGKVTRLFNFGAMVEILPGKEGMVHISEMADYRVAKVEDVVKVGDEIMVKVIEVDRQGRINLSRRAVFDDPKRGTAPPSNTPRGSGPAGQSPRPPSPPFRQPFRGPGGSGPGFRSRQSPPEGENGD